MNLPGRDVSHAAADRPKIVFPAPGVIRVVSASLFADPDANACRQAHAQAAAQQGAQAAVRIVALLR